MVNNQIMNGVSESGACDREWTMSGFLGTAMVSLVNELREGRLKGLKSKEVQEMNLSGDETNHSSQAVVAVPIRR